MKRLSFLYILFILFFLFPADLIDTIAQETKTMPKQRTTPERAAEAQTKWMINILLLDSKYYDDIYRINLKYQVSIDSVHLKEAFITAKQEAFIQYSQSRNEELKKIMPPDAFDKLMSLMETAKNKAAVYRTSIQI